MVSSSAVLQSVLVDLIDLGLLGKQAHWNVYGPVFRSVHLELDEMVTQLLAWQDEVAERIAALGDYPDGRSTTVAGTSTVVPLESGALQDSEVVRGFSDRLTTVSKAIATKASEMDEDLASQDVLVGIIAGLDKMAWFFRAQFASVIA